MPSHQAACITIGNFDGIHLGHQSLITLAKKTAAARCLDFSLLTFWPHPRVVLKGEAAHTPLSGRSEKLRMLSTLANVVELPFTPALSKMNAEEFVVQKLLPLDLSELVVGHDFRLGREREGHVERLRELGGRYGFHVTQAPAFVVNGAPVSSTRLRKLVAEGDVAEAACLLGRFYSVGGRVGHGFGRGRHIGFPTANLVDPDALLPGKGVYATFAICEGKKYKAVTNIGTNPTFDNKMLSVETFFLDAASDFYDEPIRIEFVALLRHERRFASPDDLAIQIGRDVEDARVILNAAG